MTCVEELRGLGEVQRALAERHGRVLAISVDPPAEARRVAEQQALPFPVLSDSERTTIRAYGLVHPGGAGGGRDIALPAQLLVRRDGTVAWQHVSAEITDRAEPARALAAIANLR